MSYPRPLWVYTPTHTHVKLFHTGESSKSCNNAATTLNPYAQQRRSVDPARFGPNPARGAGVGASVEKISFFKKIPKKS
jgi:hypothetical protein